MAILLMASLVVMLHYSRKTIREESLNEAAQTLEGTVQRIDNILLSVEQATGNMFFNLLPHLDDKDMIISSCRKLVEANPQIAGCAIAMKPYYFKDREYFMAYYYRQSNGGQSWDSDTRVTVSQDDSLLFTDSPIIQAETFGNCPYTEQIWYTDPIVTAKPKWLNPLIGIEADVEPITTFCLPIPGPDGEPIGVIGVDVSLSLLSHIVLAAKPSPNSYCTLLAADGSYIVHPDSTKLLRQLFSSGDAMSDGQLTESAPSKVVEALRSTPSAWDAANAMLSGETGYKPFTLNGQNYYVFYKPFKRAAIPGRSIEELDWSAGIIYPEDDIFGDYNHLFYYVLIIAAIGLILLFVLSRSIIHRQLKPLLMLTESAQLIAKGNYDEPIPDSHQSDEIGRLQAHFQQMQQSLSTHIGELEHLTDTLRKHGMELRAAYEHAQQGDRMKTAFMHNMTNQMVNPANAIDSAVEALCALSNKSRQESDSESQGTVATAERLTNEIQQHGKTITKILNNLIYVSEDVNGKEALKYEGV